MDEQFASRAEARLHAVATRIWLDGRTPFLRDCFGGQRTCPSHRLAMTVYYRG